MTGSGRTGPIGGVPPGLVARVQRRLAATGAVATDAAGLRAAVAETLVEDGVVLPAANLSAIVRAVGDELTGLGPLAPLLADPTVTDVLVNGPADVWVERGGTMERAAVRFASAAAVAALVQRVVAPLGLRVDESRPWVDARLPGGERFHAVLPPLAPDGPVVTIRTFARRRLELRDLIDRGALDVATARLLEAMVAAGIAIAVSGATGTGKTTLLNVLAAAIPMRERVVTVEDVAELRLPGPHVVRLEGRPPNVEGRGEVPLRELVRNALRMRPDRIVVGEVRGPEVLDMLQAANTGHRGLMTTLHAGGPEEVPARLEAMALAAPGAGLDVVRRLVGGGIGAVVHLERAPAGRPMRRVAVVAELVTSDDGRAQAIPLRTTGSADGLSATGHVPRWANRLDPSVLLAFEPTHLAGRVRVFCPRSRTRRRHRVPPLARSCCRCWPFPSPSARVDRPLGGVGGRREGADGLPRSVPGRLGATGGLGGGCGSWDEGRPRASDRPGALDRPGAWGRSGAGDRSRAGGPGGERTGQRPLVAGRSTAGPPVRRRRRTGRDPTPLEAPARGLVRPSRPARSAQLTRPASSVHRSHHLPRLVDPSLTDAIGPGPGSGGGSPDCRDPVRRRRFGARWRKPSRRSSTSSARPWAPASTLVEPCRPRPRALHRPSRTCSAGRSGRRSSAREQAVPWPRRPGPSG